MRPKKHLGQHFLTTPSYAQRVVEAIPAAPGDNILEIGPGQGALSIFLKCRFPGFHCVEIDKCAIDVLRKKLGGGPYTIHNHDVLTFDFALAGFPLHVVGNLPYSIGAHIIRKTLLYGSKIVSFTFMVQREVAVRITAPPHGKTYGFLSVFCSFFGTPHLLFNVPRGAFFPTPKVDSSVIQLIVDAPESKLPQPQWEAFFALVGRGFQQRRKKVINALGDDEKRKKQVAAALEMLDVNQNARPEDLSCAQWLELYRRIC